MEATPITSELLARWSADYNADERRQLATLALAKHDVNEVAFVSAGAQAMRQKFSLEIKTLEVTNQMSSGRCWLFAATNVLREAIAHDLNLEKFELSQSYLAFWDKFERANYFLESILETAELPTSDRTVSFILATGVHDGGQWDMFVNIVRKYGIVPKDVYDETYPSSHTGSMNAALNRSLIVTAIRLRGMVAAGETAEAIKAVKDEALGRVYGFLCSCYGEPPRAFDFEYVDKDGGYHIEKGLTPRAFAERYADDMLGKTVSIINAPTKDKPFHRPYTIRLLKSIPKLGRKVPGARLDAISGNVPIPLDPKDECGFCSRCLNMEKGVCDAGVPEFVEVEPGHLVRCAKCGKGVI